MVMVTVDVEVGIDEFSDEEILAEFKERKLEGDVDWVGLYILLHVGDEKGALAALREICQDQTGRVLP